MINISDVATHHFLSRRTALVQLCSALKQGITSAGQPNSYQLWAAEWHCLPHGSSSSRQGWKRIPPHLGDWLIYWLPLKQIWSWLPLSRKLLLKWMQLHRQSACSKTQLLWLQGMPESAADGGGWQWCHVCKVWAGEWSAQYNGRAQRGGGEIKEHQGV